MNIHFVGTSSMGPQFRSACTLVDKKILIDCGNGTVKTLFEQGIELSDIEAIFITHLHGDHYFDLPFLILTKIIKKAENNISIYCPKGTISYVKDLYEKYAFPECNFEEHIEKTNIKLIEIDELKNVEFLEGYFVNSYEVDHDNLKPAYGYTISHNGKTVGFSGDSAYCESVEKIIGESDCSVLDCCSVYRKAPHMNVEDIEMICNNGIRNIHNT